MPASPILFVNDRLHISNSSASIYSASSTDTGYATANIREANLVTAWKPNDSASDQGITIDLGATEVLGGAGETAWIACAYDMRGTSQTAIQFWYNSLDDPTFGTGTHQNVGAITAGTNEVGCAYFSFTLADTSGATTARYWKLGQNYTDRSSTNPTGKILYWGLYSAADVIRVASTGYAADAPGPYAITTQDRVGIIRTTGGVVYSSAFAKPGQSFTLNFEPATETLFEALRDKLFSPAGAARAYFTQFEGLRNPGGTADFFLAQPTSPVRQAQVPYVGTYFMQFEMETCPWL